MTITRSAIPATTPRSWVMIISDAPILSRAARSASSTWAWMVTSRAVVGSSAIITSGSLAIAIAITIRCRWPPENSCGKSSTRRGAFGIPTSSSSSMAFLCASSLSTWPRVQMVSATCRPR